MPLAVIDVDGCVADLIPEWCRRWQAKSGQCIPPGELRADIRDCVVPHHRETIMEHLKDADLYEYVQPVGGAVEGIRELRKLGFDVLFASLCTFGAVDQKARWLVRHGLTLCDNATYTDRPELFLPREFAAVTRKDLLRADVIIEDNAENALRWCNGNGGVAFLIDYVYNRHFIETPHRGGLCRVPTPPKAWSTIIELISDNLWWERKRKQ